jgi:hypothetical protein
MGGCERGSIVSTADSARPNDATLTTPRIPDQELAAIMRRAAAIGVPAWRVATALDLPLPAGASDAPASAR